MAISKTTTILILSVLFAELLFPKPALSQLKIQAQDWRVLHDETDSATFFIKKAKFLLADSDRVASAIFLKQNIFNEFRHPNKKRYFLYKKVQLDSCLFMNKPLESVSGSKVINYDPFYYILYGLKISNSYLNDYGDFVNISMGDTLLYKDERMEYILEIEKTDVEALRFTNIYGRIHLIDNPIEFGEIHVGESNIAFNFSGNYSDTSITAFFNNNRYLDLQNFVKLCFSEVSCDYTKTLSIQKNVIISSNRDNLGAVRLINRDNSINSYYFSHSRFSKTGDYYFRSESKKETKTSLYFDECKFENETKIYIANLDSLFFTNCRIDSNLVLKIDSNAKPMAFKFDSTDLTHLNFDFPDNMYLAFEIGMSPDQKSQIFNLLLEKFQREGKTNSLKNVDILFKQFKYHEFGILGETVSIADKYWWNYGYDKKRIIYITVGALLVFFLINLSIARSLLAYYPILAKSTVLRPSKFKRFINHLVIMFILTIYIFFSLRIELDKIQTNKTRLLIYFFVQYFFGLICLLFLFGAIVKF